MICMAYLARELYCLIVQNVPGFRNLWVPYMSNLCQLKSVMFTREGLIHCLFT